MTVGVAVGEAVGDAVGVGVGVGSTGGAPVVADSEKGWASFVKFQSWTDLALLNPDCVGSEFTSTAVMRT